MKLMNMLLSGLHARPGASYIAYASQLRGKIGLKNMLPGMYKFRWLGCATGKEVVQEKVGIAGGDQTWQKPNAIGDELALYIQRVGR